MTNLYDRLSTGTHGKKIIAVMPIYNEEPHLRQVLERLHGIDVMVLVNDGSSDNCHEIIRHWMQGRSDVFYINLPRNMKNSYALLKALDFVRYLLAQGIVTEEDLVVTIDADGQHNPDEIPAMVDFLHERNLDMVITRRSFDRYPVYKRLGNRLLCLWASLLCRFSFQDIESGLRLMRAGVIPSILAHVRGYRYSFCQESAIVAVALGLRVSNNFPIEIVYYRSRTRLRDVAINAIMGLVARFRVALGRRRVQTMGSEVPDNDRSYQDSLRWCQIHDLGMAPLRIVTQAGFTSEEIQIDDFDLSTSRGMRRDDSDLLTSHGG